jgi:type III restriction enzyme
MDTLFQKIKQEALIWQENWYKNDEFPAIAEILWYSRQSPDEGEALWKLRFLREPQFEALVVYWYLRIELKTPSFIELYRHFYPKKKDFREILGIWENPEITEMIEEEIDYLERIKTDFDFVKKYWLDGLHESLNLDYPSYILALTMGRMKNYAYSYHSSDRICNVFRVSWSKFYEERSRICSRYYYPRIT